jgi:hypothetical protein
MQLLLSRPRCIAYAFAMLYLIESRTRTSSHGGITAMMRDFDRPEYRLAYMSKMWGLKIMELQT